MKRHRNAQSKDSCINPERHTASCGSPSPILLIGGGGHALSLLEIMDPDDYPAGYSSPEPSGRMPLPWIGDDDTLRGKYPPGTARLVCAYVYGGRPDLSVRRKLIESFPGYSFPTVIAPSAIVTPSSLVGEGTQIMHRCVINRATIGNHCIVNTGAIVEHDCQTEDNVFIGPGAILGGEVSIGSDSFIGLGATVRNGVKICSGAVIGMGTDVMTDITKPGIYVGHGKRLIRPPV